MSAFRLSKSQRPKLSSFDLLHNGIKRTVDKQQYTKIFTKIKINTKIRNQPFTSNTNRQTIQNLQNQHQKLKENVKLIEASNKYLSSKINKVYKLENILCKKIENQDIRELNLEKALQIKLLLQCEAVEEQLKQKQEEFDRIFKQQKQKQESNDIYQDQAHVQLYALLYADKHSMGKIVCEKQQKIDQCHDILAKIREKTHKLKEYKKLRKEQVKQIDKIIQVSKQHLPSINKVTDQNDSVIFGTQTRGKSTTDSLEKEIQKLHQDNLQFQHHIQELTETKIKEKIQILKAIDQLENLIINQNVTNRRELQKIFF